MVVASPVPVQITEEAEHFVLEMGLQEPLLRMLDEIPKRFPGVHSIDVFMEYIVDEAGRPVVTLQVPRQLPVERADPVLRQWGQWVSETFPPQVLEHLGVMPLYLEAHAG